MKKKLGFSIAELAIAVLIIGLIIGGISTGSKLVTHGRIKAAKKASDTSPIWKIYNDNLNLSAIAWYDVAFEDSITYDTGDGDVSEWKSKVNPYVSMLARQETGTAQPNYEANGMKGYPGILFNGSSDFLELTAPISYADDSYTIAVVWYANGTTEGGLFAQADEAATAANSAEITISTTANATVSDAAATSGTITTDKINANVFVVNEGVSGEVVIYDADYHNTSTAADSEDASSAMTLGVDRALIGALWSGTAATSFFDGYLAELVIFDKALTTDEVAEVTEYFTTKYKIR